MRVEGSFFSDTVKYSRFMIRDIGGNSRVAGEGGLFEGGTYFVRFEYFAER